jgi:hypothetical protein
LIDLGEHVALDERFPDSHIANMTKRQFLKDQYFDMLASGTRVCERWQDSFQNFFDDLEHVTPGTPGRRYLAVKEPELGFAPQNVEWHFHSIVKAPRKVERTAKTELESAKEKRRKMIAEQYRQWEAKMAARRK